LLEKVYEAFDFAASRFIQVMIRKLHLHRACWMWQGATKLALSEVERERAVG
jgi:hypothetical protein